MIIDVMCLCVTASNSAAAAAGAVDEELFIKSFEDVPKVKVSQDKTRQEILFQKTPMGVHEILSKRLTNQKNTQNRTKNTQRSLIFVWKS